jgi:hypothetical protein
MVYAIVPVTAGMPDIDFNIALPLQSFQVSDSERYCVFSDGVDIRPTWQIITEAEFAAARPPAPEPPPPPPTMEDLQAQVAALGAGMVQLMLLVGGGS